MITQKNIDNLYNISANLAFIDYRIANPQGKYKKHRPYSLGYDSQEAHENYKLALQRKHISKEEESKVKAYLLSIKFRRPNLLVDNWEFASQH